MKANEFVKKFGFREAKIALLYCKSASSGTVFYKNIQVDTEDLKRLVESLELVNEYGGLEGAKCYVDSHDLYEAICDEDGNICDYVSNVDLIDAILDVESCL